MKRFATLDSPCNAYNTLMLSAHQQVLLSDAECNLDVKTFLKLPK